MKKIAVDPFTGQPRIEEVPESPRVSVGPQGPPGPDGAPGADGTVPDEAYTVDTIRMCDWSFGAFDSSVWNLGTGGTASITWRRVGRKVEGWIVVRPASDATTPSGFFIIVHPDDLPYVPKVESATSGQPMPGGFGALYKADTAGSPPYNGFRHGLSPIVQDIGTGQSLMIFFRTESESAITSGADNLWSPVSNTPVAASSMPGASYTGAFEYQAASAA